MSKYDRPLFQRKKVYEVPLIKQVKDRPTCKNCDHPLKPYYHYSVNPNPDPTSWVASYVLNFKGEYGYEGNNHFCSMRCGYNFARAAVRAGYRKVH